MNGKKAKALRSLIFGPDGARRGFGLGVRARKVEAEVPRTWRERWLSWPWRPLVKAKKVEKLVPVEPFARCRGPRGDYQDFKRRDKAGEFDDAKRRRRTS